MSIRPELRHSRASQAGPSTSAELFTDAEAYEYSIINPRLLVRDGGRPIVQQRQCIWRKAEWN
jgi:hypothetical protein